MVQRQADGAEERAPSQIERGLVTAVQARHVAFFESQRTVGGPLTDWCRVSVRNLPRYRLEYILSP